MNKKGGYDVSRKWIYWILALFLFAFMFLYMRNAIASHNDVAVEHLDKIEGAVIISEAIFSPKCFSYYDKDLGRAYPGIIDLAKFNEERFNEDCFVFIENPFTIKLGDITLGNSRDEELEKIIVPVLVKDGEIIRKDKLEIGVMDYYGWEGQDSPREGAYYKRA